MKTLYILIITLFIHQTGFCQNSGNKTLLIGEFYTDKNNDQHQYLIGLKFSGGILQKRDTIYYGPTFKKDKKNNYSPFFGIEFGNKICNNRYLVTFGGFVVDMKEKKMLKEADGNLIRSTSDTLIFFTENLFRGTYYTFLELKTGNLTKKEIKDYKRDYSDTIQSPNGKYAIEIDYSKLPYRIFLRNDSGKELIVPDAGTGTPLVMEASTFPRVPVAWIDSTKIIYCKFDNNYNVKFLSGEVVLVDVYKRTKQIIGKLDNLKEARRNARFLFNDVNELLLRYSESYFYINTDSVFIKEITRYKLNHSFSFDLAVDKDWKQKIFFQGEQIGYYHFLDSYTTSGFIALGMRDKGTYTGADKVGIWNENTKAWLIIPEPHLIDIIGWIDE